MAAALETKRRKKELPREDLEIFVLRQSPESKSFLWQIRLFGGCVLRTSDGIYPSLETARNAGIVARSSFDRGPAVPPGLPTSPVEAADLSRPDRKRST